jgi:tRNA threonylcarbamoyladenosine biosynthesis protein TsaB
MIVLLDTSTPTCKLTLVDGEYTYTDEWQADRTLAKHLLRYLTDKLEEYGSSLNQIEGIGVMKGPGSFTGLRIGLTVLNTIADANAVPIVGETGENWQKQALDRLTNGESDRIVLPVYGREANITTPRK